MSAPKRTVREVRIPMGSWPRRMNSAYAAGYVGEPGADTFMARVGTEYPAPRINEGRRKLWLRDDLDRAIGAMSEDVEAGTFDAADVL